MEEESRLIRLRLIKEEDCSVISAAFQNQGWNKPVTQYESYVRLVESGERDVVLATVNEEFAGYLTIQWSSTYQPFREADIPEVVDFNVLRKFQRMGIGTILMDEAELRIGKVSDIVGIGVGLVEDYGPAQVLYARRGYIPDGRGATYQGQTIAYHSHLTAGDDLILHMTKKLR